MQPEWTCKGASSRKCQMGIGWSELKRPIRKTTVYKIAYRPETGGKESTKEMLEERRKGRGRRPGYMPDCAGDGEGWRREEERGSICDSFVLETPRALVPLKV